jgi:hypothetical protein
MKTLFTTLLLALSLRGAEVSFEWNPSPDVSVTGYRLYIGTNDFVGINNISIVLTTATTNVTWTNAEYNVNYWAYCTAYNDRAESKPSNIIKFSKNTTNAIKEPNNFRIK